jgi:prepilin-type N-terminal cleavage/methylation domain-containing protein
MTLRTARPGFTLLEVMLSMAIGILLLSALYVAVDTQLKSAQAAREIVEQSTLARTLLTRMADDIAATIQLSDPGRFRNQQNAANGNGMGTGGMGTGTGTGAGTGTGTGTGTGMGTGMATGGTGAGTTGTTGTTDTGNTNTVSIPLGLIGDSSTLHMYVTALPRELVHFGASDLVPPLSDTRRISYWLVGGGDGPGGGLAKQEVQPVTSDDALNNLPPGSVGNENDYIIADEVRSLTFSYFDGTNWNDTWDSAQPGPDGVTPMGPPRAVSIEIGLPGVGGPNKPLKIYRHVVSLVTANGATTQQQTNPTTGSTTSP